MRLFIPLKQETGESPAEFVAVMADDIVAIVCASSADSVIHYRKRYTDGSSTIETLVVDRYFCSEFGYGLHGDEGYFVLQSPSAVERPGDYAYVRKNEVTKLRRESDLTWVQIDELVVGFVAHNGTETRTSVREISQLRVSTVEYIRALPAQRGR